MKLSKIENAQKYQGLYIVDFGDSCSVGFTAREVEELIESEKFSDIKIYKIHRAYPDGKIEYTATAAEKFRLESGMFFLASDSDSGVADYEKLVNIAIVSSPPGRAKVQLAKYDDNKYVTAIIYPAEYEDDFSHWLLEADYKSSGPAVGGAAEVKKYYDSSPVILQKHQLSAYSREGIKTGTELFAAAKKAVVR